MKKYRKRKNKNLLNINHGRQVAFKRITAPENLTLRHQDVEGVLKFIKKIKNHSAQGKNIELHLEQVKVIAEGAIAMLLSVISEAERKNIYFKGIKPRLQKPKDILEASGFFNHMKGHVSMKNKMSKNKILKTGDKDTQQTIISPEIHKSMETIWGTKSRCPCLYGGIGEMMRNSCDHAFANYQHTMWHLGISHLEKENAVKFSFVDNGLGILRTYKNRSLYSKLRTLFKNDAELLKAAFNDGIESKTGLPWRGKGLPTIFEMYTDNLVTSLVVITNNVYLDFDENIVLTTKTSFEGTYYFWRIDRNCCKQSHFPIKNNTND